MCVASIALASSHLPEKTVAHVPGPREGTSVHIAVCERTVADARAVKRALPLRDPAATP